MPEEIQLTPEQAAQYNQVSAGAPAESTLPVEINPIRDFDANQLAELAVKDKEGFDLVGEFRRNQDLWADPAIVQKAADALNIVKQRGFEISDLPGPKKIGQTVLESAKGFGKQLWNYGSAAVGIIQGAIAEPFSSDLATGFAEGVTEKLAKNIAGTEEAMAGLSQIPGKAIRKIGQATGLAKDFNQFTPEEKLSDLWKDVGVSEVQQSRVTGQGPFTQAVTGGAAGELPAEEVSTLAAGDPFSFVTFSKGFQLAGKAIPGVVRGAISKTGEQAGEVAATVGGRTVQTAGKVTELGAKAAQAVAPAAGLVKGAIEAGPVGALAGLKAGEIAASVAKRVSTAGAKVAEAGKQVSGATPVTSSLAQAGRDILQAAPGAAGTTAIGLGQDIGLSALTSETPAETQGAIGIGTALGAAGAVGRVGRRVISGQLVAPREYGVSTVTPSSGNFPTLDVIHSDSIREATPGEKTRLNAIRLFAKGAAPGTDIIFARDPAALTQTLTDLGIAPDTAAQFAQQEGFFTQNLPDKNGNVRPVIIVRNLDAAPHEAFHAVQDVLGEAANRELDNVVRQEYSDQWENEGNRYATRLVGDLAGRDWRETILDESGWGHAESMEKLSNAVANEVIGQTGAEPTPGFVADRVRADWRRIYEAARSRNPAARPEQVWREILSPEESAAVADRYLARELAAENFDVVFKNLGASLGAEQPIVRKLAGVAAKLISTLGGEPLAGRRSDIGQIEPRFGVTEAVTGAARGREAKPVVEPKSPRQPVSVPRTTEEAADAATVARDIASSAPETARERLGAISEAIAQRAGVKINYLSAPGEPAAATTSNRVVRREIIEAFRTMPPEARSLWEKNFFPERVIRTKAGKYQILGWAPEVFASNAHKLAGWLADHPNLAVPYAIDTATKSFTPDAWQQLFADTQQFVRNQQAGATGAGETLVVPENIRERGFTAPAKTGGESPLAQDRADVINMLFGFKLPETPRIQKGRLPLAIVGEEISAATQPGRVEVPVRPRGEFTGIEAAAQDIAGRPIQEVNPFRNAVEAAGNPPSLIEAVQRLNLENIKEVAIASEQPEFRGNTLTLTAGFQPKSYESVVDRMDDLPSSLLKDYSRVAKIMSPGMTPEQVKALPYRDYKIAIDILDSVSEDLGRYANHEGIQPDKVSRITSREGNIIDVQFQPSAHPRAVDKASVRDEQGRIFTGAYHGEAMEAAKAAGSQLDYGDFDTGFVDKQGNWLTRAEAFKRAEEINQLQLPPPEQQTRMQQELVRQGLESVTFGEYRQFQPGSIKEEMARLPGMTQEDWKAVVGNYKGKLGGGLTGWAFDLGASAKTLEDVTLLRETAQQLGEASKQAMRAGDFSKAMEFVGRSQAAREAFEAATGRTMDGTQEAGVPFIRKHVDPNYNPPVPPAGDVTPVKVAAQPRAEVESAKRDYELEKDFANKFVSGETKLSDFPYFKSYQDTINSEASLLSPNSKVLFVGSGPVPLSAIMLSKKGFDVTGLEISPEALELGKKVSQKEGTPVSFRQGDASKISLDGYDAVVVALEAGASPEEKAAVLRNVAKSDAKNILVRSSSESEGGETFVNSKELTETNVGNIEKSVKTFDGLGETFLVQLKRQPRVGTEFTKFFTDVTKGTFGKSDKPFVPTKDLSELQNVIETKTKHSGNFDDHIAKSIPTFYETQIQKAKAIADSLPEGGRVLDIAASEGSFGKTISELSDGTVETVSLDPNEAMAGFFETKSQVPGATYVKEAFLNGFESDGVNYVAHDGGPYDVVTESMGFQFIDPDRAAQISEAKRLLKPNGVFLTEQKVRNSQWAANEKKKDTQFKSKYFSTDELAAKDQKVGFAQSKDEVKSVGMVDNMADQQSLEDVLTSNFKHVVQYWDAGNFKGYAASDNAAELNRIVERMGDTNSEFSTEQMPRRVEPGAREDFEFQARQQSFQPARQRGEQLKFAKTSSGGFKKAWVLPSGEPVQLGGTWHHEWLSDNPGIAKKYKLTVPDFTGSDTEQVREDALRAGFARINYGVNNGTLTVEARAKDWRKVKNAVEDMVSTNLDDIDNIRVTLFDDAVKEVVDSDSSALFNLDTDQDKLAAIPFITKGEIRGQFQPQRAEQSEGTLFDLPETASFPEAVIPKRGQKDIPSDIVGSPLFKQAKTREDAISLFADKLKQEAERQSGNPAFSIGKRWYSEFTPLLKKEFGDDAPLMAELLAATSPQTNVEVNFGYAIDVLNNWKAGKFDKLISKLNEGYKRLEDGSLAKIYRRDVRAGKVESPPETPTDATYIAHWILKHDLLPRGTSGAQVGLHSKNVAKVLTRRWLSETKGPKTRNFVQNLIGTGDEATIDIWADRLLRRIGYEGFVERWRIKPENVKGVADDDFEFGQQVFRAAADRLGMKPSDLQAALWFTEKQRWADNGWSDKLDLGDFRTEIKRTEEYRRGFAGGKGPAEVRGEAKRVVPEYEQQALEITPRRVRMNQSQPEQAAERYPADGALIEGVRYVQSISKQEAEDRQDEN